ncbi:hypothetical protein Cgig2_008816 [Carnegiea gigantea]|uniref:Uncharacterized protein n=1 Tax=Carnegiea gigantea TaxID=171969 RepID=A0A9Q1GLL7_9CARY|nr:hypothetical protein Cgig2_008816 [Carnegiea gigantea]
MQQENNDEVRAKAMASDAQIPNSDSDKFPPPPPPKVREEGELTSSDDDALPLHADAPSTSISAPPSSTLPNVSLKTYLQSRNPGKPISASLPARAADKHRQASGYSKGFNRNKVLLKSSNPGWHAPAGNANLVISFSDDDDSGSGEEMRQKTAQATIRHPQVANSSQRPPALPHMKPDTARRTAKNEGKVVTKKVALNRTFMSSMTKIHGSDVKVSGPPAERKSWSKNSNVTGRILPSQDGRFNKRMDLSSNKLQDLRQQIAMRENELMLKKVQKSKENVSEPCRDIDVMGQSKVSSKKSRTASPDGQTDTEKPDAKRLKLAQNSRGQPSSRGHQDKSFVLVPSNDSISVHVHDVKKIGQKGLLPSSSEMQIQDRKQLPTSSHNERIRLTKDASGVGVSCSLSDWVSRPVEALAVPKQPASLTNATFADHLDKSWIIVVLAHLFPSFSLAFLPSASNIVFVILQHTDLLNKSKSSSSVLNHDMCVNNMNKVNDHYATVFVREKLMSKSDSSLQPRSLLVLDKFESPTASPDNTSVLHSLDKPTVSGCDVDSLFEMEELHDKELEEAQEHRRRCEIEERKALKAYRNAQRALAEANARCTYLYRKRELYSAQLRSFLMEDCSVLLTSRQHRQIGDTWNLSYNVCEANMDRIPTSSHQLQAECEPDNQVGYGSNAQSADGDAHNRLSGNEDGNNLCSEACSEPDASTSDLLVHGNSSIANGVLLPSNDPNLSPDDGETFPLDHRPVQDALTWPREEDNSKGSEKDMNVDSARCFTVGSSQDPLSLEAYLRSKLFSRLGVIDSLKKTGAHSDSKSTAAKVAEENFASGKTQIVEDNVMLSDSKDISAPNGEGSVEPDNRISETILNIENQKPVEEHSLNNSRALAFDYEDTIFHSKEITSASIISSSCIFRSAMMAACRSKLNDVQIIEQQEFSPGMHIDNELLPRKSEDESSLEKASWPEEPGSSSNCPKQRGCIESGVLTPPKYVVCFDSLKAESQTHDSPLTHHVGASSKNIFSSSLAVSNSLVKQLPSDEPYLHGNDGCVDSFVGGGHSLYFQSRNGAGNPLRNGLGDSDQALEIGLLVLNQEVSSIDGMKKALSVLSRALEADCALFQLWIVYLLLYHSTVNSVSELSKKTSSVEDDLFSHAVSFVSETGSFRVYSALSSIMYNHMSVALVHQRRRRLNDRFAAYERALPACATMIC